MLVTNVHWVIQENQPDAAAARAIVEVLDGDGHVAHLVRLERGVAAPVPDELPDDAPIVCHGPGFITRALHHPRLASGLFFDPDVFRWSAFQAAWGEAMLAPDARVIGFADALEALADISHAFIRPDADSKAFEGGVYDRTSLVHATTGLTVDETLPVVLARPVPIDAEWRFFIVGSEVVACSEYRRWGRPSIDGAVPHVAIELAAELASRWSPADIYCLDLASANGRIGVVEANCFNGARFYGADPRHIVRATNAHVLDRHLKGAT
jgi:hypothetical protein